ncbi:MAG: hypothetical protein IDH49_09485 [Gammaproteobacteria bacterium]|nr:hypothetical protein [Gammaproteobacteria bacterium]
MRFARAIGHDAFQESIEQRRSEGGISLRRAVDHTFLDETVAHGRHALHFDTELIGYISRPMRPFAQLRQGPEILLFARRQAVEADAKEVRIEPPDGFIRRLLDGVDSDGRLIGKIPCLVSPLLKEIGVALGLADDFLQRLVRKTDILLHDRLLQGSGGILGLERPKLRELEQALGVGFRAAPSCRVRNAR